MSKAFRAAFADGTWDKILAKAQVYDDGHPTEWTISIDSSIVRAHQHAAGTRKKGAPASGRSRRTRVRRLDDPAAG
jgi:hypothetical protein